MKTISLACLVSVAFIARLPAADLTPAEIAKLEQELTKQFQDTADAFVKGDRSPAIRNLADDYVLIDHYGELFDRVGAVELVNAITAEQWKIDEVKVRPYGDVLVVTSRTTAKAKGRRGDLTGQYRVTGVHRNRDGRWLNVSAQYTKIAQP